MNQKLYQKWENVWSKLKEKETKNGKETLVAKIITKDKIKILRKILTEINPKSAIEIGCGLGFTFSVFKELGIDALCIDVSKTAVKICRQKNLNSVEQKLEDTTEKYDLVFSDGVLEHFLNFEPYAQKMTEISRKYIIIIQNDHCNFLGKTLTYLTEIFRASKNVMEYNYTIDDFIDIFKKYDYELVTTKNIFYGTFKLILFKKYEPAIEKDLHHKSSG